jgi:tocopherol cyclase
LTPFVAPSEKDNREEFMHIRSILSVGLVLTLGLGACDDDRRNGYMLDPQSGVEFGYTQNPLTTNGYDWWWHSFVGRSRTTGKQQPFFIEYYVINPGLGGPLPILGQDPANKAAGRRPSYAMIKAGTWAENASAEINNYYGIADLDAAIEYMDVRIGPNTASEVHLTGAVFMSAATAAAHPEYMSDAGEMEWDLTVDKTLTYSVGYATSDIVRNLNAFQMFWHVQGMKAEYAGTVTFNGEVFDVIPGQSYGYQDKNWGNDLTNPWIWLNCNNFKSATTGKALPMTSLDVGGGEPVAFGIPLGRKVLVAFHHDNTMYEWNFTKELQWQSAVVTESSTSLRWQISAEDLSNKIVIDFSAPKSRSLKVDYENPRGEKKHNNLWNSGWASGTVTLYSRAWWGGWRKIDTFVGSMGGAEYGQY